MTSEEYQISEEFKINKIYPQLYQDWIQDPNGEIKKWSDSWKYHHVPENTLKLWNELEQSYLIQQAEQSRVHEEALLAR